MRQFALPLGWPAEASDGDFLIGPSNAQALRLLEDWGSWPVRTALLTGPRRSGRTRYATIFAVRSGGRVLDDADRQPEAEVFHAWNRAQDERRPLLLVAEEPPPRWSVALPDLRSRLAAGPHARFDPPDDELLRALLTRQLDRRRLDARLELVDWIAPRIRRDYLAVDRAVEALDGAALAERRRLSIPFARATLQRAGLIVDGTATDRGEEP